MTRFFITHLKPVTHASVEDHHLIIKMMNSSFFREKFVTHSQTSSARNKVYSRTLSSMSTSL